MSNEYRMLDHLESCYSLTIQVLAEGSELAADLPEHDIFLCYQHTFFFPNCCWKIQIIPNSCYWGITKSTSPDVAKSRHITAKYFQPERILSVVVNAAQRTRVKVEADSRPSVDTHTPE